MNTKIKCAVAALCAVLVVGVAAFSAVTLLKPKPIVATELESPPPAGEALPEDSVQLDMKQDGDDLLYSTDGGKTWSKELPADAGMSVKVEVVEE
jgi:photosystem II stability/assembly factor-like uncharacterized protein